MTGQNLKSSETQWEITKLRSRALIPNLIKKYTKTSKVEDGCWFI